MTTGKAMEIRRLYEDVRFRLLQATKPDISIQDLGPIADALGNLGRYLYAEELMAD